MRILLSILCLTLMSSQILAEDINTLMQLKPSRIPYLPYKKDNNIAYLQTPFSKADIVKEINTDILKNTDRIYAIHLVYTRFREVDSFNQPKLNYYRFTELKKKYPELFKLKNVHWKVLEQQKATTKETAANYFHGFVIYLAQEIPTTRLEGAISIIKEITDSYKDSFVVIPPSRRIKVKRRRVNMGIYYPVSSKKRRNGITYSKPGIWGRREKTYIEKDTTVLWEEPERTINVGSFDTRFLKNIDVYTTLVSIPHSQVPLVICDVTGSMAPHAAEVMLWVKNQPGIRQKGKFIFFNDGDNTPDQYKILGKTGGIYTAQHKHYDSIFATMASTMLRGTGGFPPENYCEAIISGLKQFPSSDTVIVIADMSASASDIELVDLIKKPVNIILAGSPATTQIPADYIEIALKTGGSLFYKGFRINPALIGTQERTFLGDQYVVLKSRQIKKL